MRSSSAVARRDTARRFQIRSTAHDRHRPLTTLQCGSQLSLVVDRQRACSADDRSRALAHSRGDGDSQLIHHLVRSCHRFTRQATPSGGHHAHGAAGCPQLSNPHSFQRAAPLCTCRPAVSSPGTCSGDKLAPIPAARAKRSIGSSRPKRPVDRAFAQSLTKPKRKSDKVAGGTSFLVIHQVKIPTASR